MKLQLITRRQFFKLHAFGLSAVAAASLSSIASAAPEWARAGAEAVRSVMPQPTFNAIPLALPLGTPPADISMGWDGTLWAIDASGAPYQFDPQQQHWSVHGHGLDAAV